MEERKSSENENDTKNGTSIAAWIVVLFLLTFLCALPIIIGGVSMPKLSPSVPLFPLYFAGNLLSAYTPLVAALLVARFFPSSGGARALLRQIRTWRIGMAWYALALIGTPPLASLPLCFFTSVPLVT